LNFDLGGQIKLGSAGIWGIGPVNSEEQKPKLDWAWAMWALTLVNLDPKLLFSFLSFISADFSTQSKAHIPCWPLHLLSFFFLSADQPRARERELEVPAV
jgi:hypothetical protein